MVDLKRSDIRIIDEAFESESGYCLNFSNRTFSEYFEDEFRINIDDSYYHDNGSSKMNRLRIFFRISDASLAAKVMRNLAEYREKTYGPYRPETKEKLFGLIASIEGKSEIALTDALERFTSDQTLDEIIGSIERDINADKPAVAIDRLHIYCLKRFSHLLTKRGITWTRNEPLHSRIGKYVKAVDLENPLQDMTKLILKSSISVFDRFNHIRNNQSLAHDNDLLSKAEARFIFDSVSALLRFVKSVDMARFED